MQSADVYFQSILAGRFFEGDDGGYRYEYQPGYHGYPLSLTMPVRPEPYLFDEFPPFFDGLLPEGVQLEALLKQKKLDRNDKFGQLLCVGADTVGAVTIAGIS